MLATIGAWLASYAGGIIAKFAVDLLSNWLSQRQADANAKQVGASEVAAKVNAETVETQDAMGNIARPSDDAVADSLRSGKF